MKSLISITIISVFITLTSFKCNKNDSNNLVIDGFRVTDFSGNFITQIGGVDNDWTLMDFGSLPSTAQNLLNSNDGVGVPIGVSSAITISNIQAYPNPCNQAMNFSFKSTDSVKVKMVIVDEYSNVLVSSALRFKGIQSLGILTNDRSKFVDKKGVRLYYSFSTQANPNFTCGYGDIKICNTATGSAATATACF